MSELRTNRIVPRDGLPAGSAGGIIQVKQVVKTDRNSLTSTSTEQLIPGMEVSITPTRSDSKILVTVVLQATVNNTFAAHYAVLKRNTNVPLCRGDADGSRTRATFSLSSPTFYDNFSNNYGPGNATINFLDSPATTSTITYGLYHADTTNDNTLIINGTMNNGDSNIYCRTASMITLMEVSG